MKIQFMSDLHLEFENEHTAWEDRLTPPSGGADVLVLAGDIHVGTKAWEWINKAAKNYKKVFFVYGNHEFYNHDMEQVRSLFPDMLDSNVTVMDNAVEEFEGVNFIGTTLWANMQDIAFYSMNDSRIIYDGKGTDFSEYANKPLALSTVHGMFAANSNFIMNNVKKDMKNVVITHHAPSFEMINTERYANSAMNTGYATKLVEFMDEGEVNLWISGHTHGAMDKVINGVRCVSNCRGYVGYESADNFDPNKIVEV